MRTYFKTTYKFNETWDSKIYKEMALIFNRELMMKLDSQTPSEANESFEEICVTTSEPLTIKEMKEIIKYFWDKTQEQFKNGSINDMPYSYLRPDSFEVRIQEVEDNRITQKRIDLQLKNSKIIECFAQEDLNPILIYYNDRSREIEFEIKTVADCL